MILKNVLVLLVVSLCWACESKQPTMTYDEFITKDREETTQFMNESPDSPFASADSTIRLNYYPINEKLKVLASVEIISNGSELTLGTSAGELRVYIQYAYLKFVIEDQPQQLLVLKGDEKEDGLFLAFTDLTSDETTYGGGRYLNLNFSDKAKKVTLDFNLAYNPYCEYSATYSCPLPPVENQLPIAIEAGEKLYN
ncbi:DUF1684 domain-containing protein [Reichenbachiella carrageenanivorans]|uniref:DUF1684 domain-containing protein n=1 Tax=Reichenbachiella carrageenanivorans TaxID=2979869 RepID=A0ABY6D0G7_9BACT|nr:DUF1684 domain-containing protein [Reichenbachiella carrageenanivorans]UXX79667.1 DUF1684 domain-containing protein [Reichenbachiella carrageenanivorans]